MPSGDINPEEQSPEGIYTDIYPNICTDIYTGKTRVNIKYVAYETRGNITDNHYLFEKRFWN